MTLDKVHVQSKCLSRGLSHKLKKGIEAIMICRYFTKEN